VRYEPILILEQGIDSWSIYKSVEPKNTSKDMS
jgi:hypothetical protein